MAKQTPRYEANAVTVVIAGLGMTMRALIAFVILRFFIASACISLFNWEKKALRNYTPVTGTQTFLTWLILSSMCAIGFLTQFPRGRFIRRHLSKTSKRVLGSYGLWVSVCMLSATVGYCLTCDDYADQATFVDHYCPELSYVYLGSLACAYLPIWAATGKQKRY